MTKDKTRGLFNKFIVSRTDGRSAPGEKHAGCNYFVLDRDHDKFAAPAMAAYAEACKSEYPALAADLLAEVGAKAGASLLAEMERLRRVARCAGDFVQRFTEWGQGGKRYASAWESTALAESEDSLRAALAGLPEKETK